MEQENPFNPDQVIDIDPKTLRGALLTQDRLVIYTEMEERKGNNGNDLVIFYRGPVAVGVFLKQDIIETGIDGLIKEQNNDAKNRLIGY